MKELIKLQKALIEEATRQNVEGSAVRRLAAVGLYFLDHSQEQISKAGIQLNNPLIPELLEPVKAWLEGRGELKACKVAAERAKELFVDEQYDAYYDYCHGVFSLINGVIESISLSSGAEQTSVIVGRMEGLSHWIGSASYHTAIDTLGLDESKAAEARRQEYCWMIENIALAPDYHLSVDNDFKIEDLHPRRRISPIAARDDDGLSLN